MTAILTILCALASAPLDVVTLDGEVVRGHLVSLDADVLTIRVQEAEQSLPLASLQKIRFSQLAGSDAQQATRWVELTDGSMILVSEYTVSGKSAQLTLFGGQKTEVPVRTIRAVRYRKQDEQQQAVWLRMRTERAQSDRLVIRKNDRIDSLDGVLHDISAEAVQFQLGDEIIPVKLAKIEGVIYQHGAAPEHPPAIVKITDKEGSIFEGAEWSTTDQSMSLRTPAGLQIERPLDHIAQIDFSSDKIIYLTSLEPKSIEWTPFFASGAIDELLKTFYRPKFDRALTRSASAADDGKLKLAVENAEISRVDSYRRGLAIHSRTSIVFELPEQARRFRATVGIDARVRDSGHVRLILRGDGQQLFAEPIAGTDDPRELSVDVAGVRMFEIVVDYGENQDIGDHLNLCNARIVK